MVAHARSIGAIAAAHAAGNVLLLRSVLFPLLDKDSLAMAHLDPSVIIAYPFPLQQLCTFVALSLVWNLLLALAYKLLVDKKSQGTSNGYPSRTVHLFLLIWLFSILIHFTIILCGINPAMSPVHTLLSAFYLVFNIVLPVLLYTPTNLTHQLYYQHCDSLAGGILSQLKGVINYVFGPLLKVQPSKKEHDIPKQRENQQRIQCIHQYAALGSVIGMIMCGIFQVLDRGMQIQRYPIPIIIGATFGHCGGIFIAIAMT